MGHLYLRSRGPQPLAKSSYTIPKVPCPCNLSYLRFPVSPWPQICGGSGVIFNEDAHLKPPVSLCLSTYPPSNLCCTEKRESEREIGKRLPMACSATSATASLFSSNPRGSVSLPPSRSFSHTLTIPKTFNGLRKPFQARVSRSISIPRSNSRRSFVVRAVSQLPFNYLWLVTI